MENSLSNALLALGLIESRARLSTGELLAPVLLEPFLPFSSYALLAPLSSEIETLYSVCGVVKSSIEITDKLLRLERI